MTGRYAWIIEKDRRAFAELFHTGRCEDNAQGRAGPADAPPELIYALERGHLSMFEVAFFRLYNEDEWVYQGRLIYHAPLTDGELHSVLLDFVPDYDVNRISYPWLPLGDAYITTTQEGEDIVRVEEQPEGDQGESRGDRR